MLGDIMYKNKLKTILETSYYVYENSSHVKINKLEINNLIKNAHLEKQQHWLASNPFGILDLAVEDIINFLVLFDSIDYSFWGEPKWTITSEIGKIDGAFALMYALLNLRKNKGHLDFEQITFTEYNNVLKGNVEIPFLKERYNTLKQISKIINSKMNGNFYNFIKDISNDSELFELIINNFPSFKDTRTYRQKTIYFYKLAQLLTSDILHIRQIKEHIKVDYSHLVGCADYKIPQILRGLNILEYDEELSNLVDTKTEIKENSVYEIEIRANMIVAIKMINEELNHNISSIDVNDFIWSLSQDKSRNLQPYHLTRTMSY